MSAISNLFVQLDLLKNLGVHRSINRLREPDCLVHSFSVQGSGYNDLIQMNPEWEFTGVYADDDVPVEK